MSVPRFSIVARVHDPPVDLLEATVRSVLGQRLGTWELCVVDDASSDDAARELLFGIAAGEPRVRVAVRGDRGGDAAARNQAIAMATGEFVGFLDPGDLLTPEALAAMHHALVFDVADYAYSDARELLADGSLGRPILHPDWSPELLRAQNYVSGLVVVRRTLLDTIGGVRSGFDGASDHDLALRATERASRVLHLPEQVMLRRTVSGSGAAVAEPNASDAGRRAVQEHCDRLGVRARVEVLGSGRYRVCRELTVEPLVSVVVATGFATDLPRPEAAPRVVAAVRSVFEVSTYQRFEVVVVAGPGTPDAVVTQLEQLSRPHRMVSVVGAAEDVVAWNVGVAAAGGQLLVFVADDVEVLTSDWIETLAGLAVEPDCGLVGAVMLSRDGSAEWGAGGGPRVERECSGVSTACAMVRREVWDLTGGMCEVLPATAQAVDLGLKIRSRGRRIVWTPHVELRRHGSGPPGPGRAPLESEALRRRWGRALDDDPYRSWLDPGSR